MQIIPPYEKPTNPLIEHAVKYGKVVQPVVGYDGHHVTLESGGVTVYLTRDEVKQIVQVSKPFLTEFILKQV